MNSDEFNIRKLIRSMERRRTRIAPGGMLFSAINNVTVEELTYFLIKIFVKDRYTTIVDPTCGNMNRHFKNLIPILKAWGIEYKPCDVRPPYDNWACINGYENCRCNVFEPESLPSGDVWFYDPPYLPAATNDRRANDYNIEVARSVDDIKKFYSSKVFEGFARRGAQLIIAKGSDFYYPQISDNLHVFLRDILELPKGWRINSIIIYRYYSSKTGLLGVRLQKAADNREIELMRPVIVHTYYVIMKPHNK